MILSVFAEFFFSFSFFKVGKNRRSKFSKCVRDESPKRTSGGFCSHLHLLTNKHGASILQLFTGLPGLG